MVLCIAIFTIYTIRESEKKKSQPISIRKSAGRCNRKRVTGILHSFNGKISFSKFYMNGQNFVTLLIHDLVILHEHEVKHDIYYITYFPL